jgi:hypothetical protein
MLGIVTPIAQRICSTLAAATMSVSGRSFLPTFQPVTVGADGTGALENGTGTGVNTGSTTELAPVVEGGRDQSYTDASLPVALPPMAGAERGGSHDNPE